MSSASDVGISPVLLQVISNSLRTAKASAIALNRPTHPTPQSHKSAYVSEILKKSESKRKMATTSDTIKNMIKRKMELDALASREGQSFVSEHQSRIATVSDLAMANALTAFATQSSPVVPASPPESVSAAGSTNGGTSASIVHYPSDVDDGGGDGRIITYTIGGQQFVIQQNTELQTSHSQIASDQNSRTEISSIGSSKLLDIPAESRVPDYTQIKIEPRSPDWAENDPMRSEAIKTMLKMRIRSQNNSLQSSVGVDDIATSINNGSVATVQSSETSASVGNVFSTLAMQHMNSADIQNSEPQNLVIPAETQNSFESTEPQNLIVPYDSEPQNLAVPAETLITAGPSSQDDRNQTFVYRDDETEVQSAAPNVQNIVIASDSNQVIYQNGKRYILAPSETNETQIYRLNDDGETYTAMTLGEDGVPTVVEGQVQPTRIQFFNQNTGVQIANPSSVLPGTPCPICGDLVSGFHYGIFTCESCKGFFKRTVQNKKTFMCHRTGECEIQLENRKKCPACRFAKCLVMGMKLEAIRADRTRGGRSSYSGLSPLQHSKLKNIAPADRKPASPRVKPYAQSPGSSQLVAMLNHGEVGNVDLSKPYVPQILTDIMNLESLLLDDEPPSEIGPLSLSDPNVLLNLLQVTELKLYKIVRWARNLPYFANISTDDQILLLQNCWCELLLLNACWRSLELTNEIIFFHGQAIDEEKATLLGIDDMFKKLLELIEQYRRLKMDQYECVTMKVLLLICPDMKGLKDPDKLSDQQMRISVALQAYTSSHYKQAPNKFGELLLRLSELSRISFVLKGHLLSWMPPDSTSCGLLFELLKGENMKDML